MRIKAKSIGLRKPMMTMKNEGLKINRGTRLQFPTICPTISDIKNLHINEYDFGESLQNGRKIYLFVEKMLEKCT